MKKRLAFLTVMLITVMLAGCGTMGMIDDSGGRDASSFEKAVIVGSARAEYLWTDRTFPGSNILTQRVAEYNGKPFNILTIKTREGGEKDLYFDISKFYKKKTYAEGIGQ